jgi:hypothetical protein
MSVIINKQGDNIYISNLKAVATIANGTFVTASYSAGTGTAVVDAAAGDKAGLLLVNNVNTKIDQELVADADFVVKSGEYLRTRSVKVGETFTTTEFTGTPAKDAILAVGATGKLVAIGVRTPVLSVAVVENAETLYGVAAIKVVVISA